MTNRKNSDLIQLEKLIRSDQLAEVYDVLEPRVDRVISKPSSFSFVLLFGSLFGCLALILGFFANLIYGFPWVLILICTGLLVAAGMGLGNIIGIGPSNLKLEKKGRALEAFLKPLLPLLGKRKTTPELNAVKDKIVEAIETEVNNQFKIKRVKKVLPIENIDSRIIEEGTINSIEPIGTERQLSDKNQAT